jgi:hypothetical protein
MMMIPHHCGFLFVKKCTSPPHICRSFWFCKNTTKFVNFNSSIDVEVKKVIFLSYKMEVDPSMVIVTINREQYFFVVEEESTT